MVELSVDEKVAILNDRRKVLVAQQQHLQGKLDKLHEKMRKKEEEGGSG